MTAWNDFVKKIYHEEKNKNSNYKFKDALKLASERKHEMGSSSSETTVKSTIKHKSKSLKKRQSKRKGHKKNKSTRRKHRTNK
jgi:hypothetical protein